MRGNVRTGVLLGVIMATLYAGYAVVLFLLRGSEPFANHETTLLYVLAMYYTAGILGGGVVGAMIPLTRSWPGLLLTGIVGALIVVGCFTIALFGPFWGWDRSKWEGVAMLGIIFGTACSIIWRRVIDG